MPAFALDGATFPDEEGTFRGGVLFGFLCIEERGAKAEFTQPHEWGLTSRNEENPCGLNARSVPEIRNEAQAM